MLPRLKPWTSSAVTVFGLWVTSCADVPGSPASRGTPKSDPVTDSGVAGAGGATVAEIPKVPTLTLPDQDAATSPVCKNLQCNQLACTSGTTAITGTVYAPNAKLPLYNVLVYVPNAPVPAVTPGLSCDRCGGIPAGEPVVSALTDHTGRFRLENAPAGKDIPLVIQVGKWRRQITIPEVTPCAETKLTDAERTRLPRNRSEGDMPRIAVTAGVCDNIACLIPKIGIDESEWGVAGEDKAVTFFGEDPPYVPTFDASRKVKDVSELWKDKSELWKYDMAILSCECTEQTANKGEDAYRAVTEYLAAGGRVFGTDFQYVWYRYSTDNKLKNASDIEGGGLFTQGPVKLDTNFPKGKALADWLKFVDPKSTYGSVKTASTFRNFNTVDGTVTQVWGSTTEPASPTFMTTNAPVGVPVAEQCGKAVHLDAHITMADTGGSFGSSKFSFKDLCAKELNNGEQVLAFFFFDLASCIQEEKKEPVVPPIVPPR
jgi:hypothetical protein